MPEPTAAAIELARKWVRCPCGTSYRERRDYDGNSPPDDEPHAPEDFDAGVEQMAVEIDSYAAERIEEATDGDRTFARLAQVERERDAAIARVRVLEAALRELPICPLCGGRRPEHRDYCSLAKAAAEEERG